MLVMRFTYDCLNCRKTQLSNYQRFVLQYVLVLEYFQMNIKKPKLYLSEKELDTTTDSDQLWNL